MENLGNSSACVSNLLRSLRELGADVWVVNRTDPSRHIQYPSPLTLCVLSMKTTVGRRLKPDAITEPWPSHPWRAENRVTVGKDHKILAE